jgi:glycosyltransferase involved in cell wall biosynthesis
MISILLATYNGEKYIKESIDSILNQTYSDWELLIGFNGTVDNSKEIVKDYNDPRIRVFDYGMDSGKAKTLNKMLKEVNYGWCAIQDDDDVWLPNKLETQIKYCDNFDVIGTFINYVDKDSKYLRKLELKCSDDEIKHLSGIGKNQVANTSAIFKVNDALKLNGWDTELDGIEDFDFWLRLMRSGKKFINIPNYLVNHRIHNNSNFNTKKYDLTKIL